MPSLAQLLLSIVAMAAVPGIAAEPDCKRLPLDPEFPAGIDGNYEVIGKHSNGPAYSGTLTLSYGKSKYLVVRTVQGRSTKGTAWLSQCGMDRIEGLMVRLETKPLTEMVCMLGGDGDNYYRMTCRTSQGIEAWFQLHE